MNVAFSRDTDQKVYVQHRIAEHSKEFNEWLEKVHRSTFVVMKNMAKDVHQAIRNVLVKEQNLTEEDAESYLKQMKKINVINVTCTKERAESEWLKRLNKLLMS